MKLIEKTSLRNAMFFFVSVASSSAAFSQVTPADELRSIQNLAQQSLPAGSTILATCGMSEGRAYYISPKVQDSADDRITDGRLVIFVDAKNEPNILFRDARGSFIDARKDGAIVVFSFLNEAKKAFGLIETYPTTGVTQTYVFSTGADSKKYLLWTTVKAHLNIADITKASAYKSVCI